MSMMRSARIFLFSLTAAAALALSVPAAASQIEKPQTETNKETEAPTEKPAEPNVPKTPVYRFVREGHTGYLMDQVSGKRVKQRRGIHEFPAGSGNFYYFKDNKGTAFAKCWIRANDKVYRAGRDGRLASGLTRVGKRTYYLNTHSFARLENKWKTINGRQYRLGKNGVLQTGLVKIRKYTYFLDPAQGGAKALGWKQIGRRTYYFNDRGRMQTGLVDIGGTKYYFSQSGIRKTGLRTINGNRYFFDRTTGAMTTGWVTWKNRKYYFSGKDGKAVVGWLLQNGKKYYFNRSGVMATGWMSSGSRKYYFDLNTGRMYTGKHQIDGKTYDFGPNGYIEVNNSPTGPWKLRVNKSTNVVTAYRGSTPVRAMLCSVGLNNATPSGVFSLGGKWSNWHELFGRVWGQYCTTVTGNILFHSVYYLRYRDPSSLAVNEYYKLGNAASHGCIRLSSADAYYIWTQVPSGTRVEINYFGYTDPLPRPMRATPRGGYDPTDPVPND